jgi:recombination protein RecT
MATSVAVVTQDDTPQLPARIPGGEKGAYALVIRAAERIAPLLPKGTTIDHVAASVYLACKKDPKLMECTPESIVQAVSRVVMWGLEIGTTAHIVPFNTKVRVPQANGGTRDEWQLVATAIADYKGIAHLMLSSGAVRAIETRVVRDGDAFDYALGLSPRLEHQPTAKSTARITHAYCILTLKFGYKTFLVMDAEEIDAIRQQHSKQWKSTEQRPLPLPAWYAKKTVLRQAAKLIPTSPRLAAVMRVVDEDTELELMEIAESARVYPARVDPDDTPVAPSHQLQHGVQAADDDDAEVTDTGDATSVAPMPATVGELRTTILRELDASALPKAVAQSFWTLAAKQETVAELQQLLERVRVKAANAAQRAAS